jgi:hypothetical protein
MTIEQLDPEKFTDQQKKVFGEAMAVRQRNAERIAKIENHGVQMDVSTARVEHTISALIHFGLLSVDQVLEIHKSWELELRKQTKVILERLDAAAAERAAEARRPKLIIPGH